MKNVYLILLIMIFTISYVAGQNLKIPDNIKPINELSPKIRENILKSFDIEVQYDIDCIQEKYSVKKPKTQSFHDTITDYYDRATGYALYACHVDNEPFPLTGWNPAYHMLGSNYNFSGNVKIVGLMVAYVLKHYRGNIYDNFYAYVFSSSFGLPEGDPLATQIFTINDIDTNSTEPVFSTIMFDQPVNVDTSFACVVSTYNNTNEYDATAIYSNLTGDGNGEESTIVIIDYDNIDNGYTTLRLAGLLHGTGISADFDLMILPIVEMSPSSVEEFSIRGFTIHNLYPNPAKKSANLKFSIENPGIIKISLIDINGNTVEKLYNDYMTAGEHNLILDFSCVQSGAYYLTVTYGVSKFAHKIIVQK